MDLLGKVAVAVVVFIIIAGIAFYIYGAFNNPVTIMTPQKATQTVISDLKLNAPTADVTLINVTPSTLSASRLQHDIQRGVQRHKAVPDPLHRGLRLSCHRACS